MTDPGSSSTGSTSTGSTSKESPLTGSTSPDSPSAPDRLGAESPGGRKNADIPSGPGAIQEPDAGGLVGIGQAARILDREFTDVSVSKLRYLEQRGLVTPARTRGGSRRFSPTDIDRLRYIIRSQRTEFLPLDVIAARLADPSAFAESHGHNQDPVPGSASAIPTPTPHRWLAQWLRPRESPGIDTEMTPGQFAKRAPASADLLEQMQQHGLIDRWDTAELELTEIVHRLHQHGIEPRHLRWLTQSAERLTALVHASLPTRHDLGAEAEAENEEVRRDLAADLLEVHLMLVRINLARLISQG